MSTTDVILELFKYVIPAGLVLAAVTIVLREMEKRQESRQRYRMRRDALATTLPLRLQAYERAILFLERISPENLIARCDGNGKTAQVFRQQLILEIKAEYEHNLTQQLYIESASWIEVIKAKEKLIGIINMATKSIPPQAGGVDLGRKIVEIIVGHGQMPTREAIEALKEEAHKLFKY